MSLLPKDCFFPYTWMTFFLARNNMEIINATKEWLSLNFEMKDMGEADYVLGVKILRDCSKRLLDFSQETYIKRILEQFCMHYSNPIDTPIEKNHTLSQDQSPKTKKKVKENDGKGSICKCCWEFDICYFVYMS